MYSLQFLKHLINSQNLQISFFLSSLTCGFRKGYSTQYAIVNLLQKWQRCLDESDGIVSTLLMDPSKGYDCVNHELVISKLAA